jgi:acyl carrier protein
MATESAPSATPDLQSVIKLIAETLQIPASELSEYSAADSFAAWDSLGQLRVCMALEERFGISVPMETIPELDSVGRILAFARQEQLSR